MSKEIKFEYGFQSINGIVKKKYYLHEIPFIAEKCDVWNVLPIVYVRQFTGLIDKNGVDIYEGDIYEVLIGDYYQVFFLYYSVYTLKSVFKFYFSFHNFYLFDFTPLVSKNVTLNTHFFKSLIICIASSSESALSSIISKSFSDFPCLNQNSTL